MIRRLVKDESGVALGLAVIMIVIMGLMGAGVQAARRQLLSDATETLYGKTSGTSPWSPNNGGKNLTFNGNTVNVKIQYLSPSTSASQLTDTDHAPELVPSAQTDYPEPKDYFKIISEGTMGDARRKIEAIYVTEDINVP